MKETTKEKNHDCGCKHQKNKEDCCCKEQENKGCSETDIQNLNIELKQQYGEMKETLQRVFAEFQNYKKRNEEEKQKFAELSTEDLIKRLLPLLDDFERALKHKHAEDEFSKGVELIYLQLIQVLEDEGVKQILSSGKFDPKLHEVLMTEESDKEEGIILEEFQKGYILGDKVIRHSKVKISKQKINH